MAKAEQTQGIPTELSAEQFRQFVLPHLTLGRRGPPPRLSLHTLFNYILRVLYMGCQWKELPIQKDGEGRSEITIPESMAALLQSLRHSAMEGSSEGRVVSDFKGRHFGGEICSGRCAGIASTG